MAFNKFIYWEKATPERKRTLKPGHSLAEIHVLVGYNQGTIQDFLVMAETIRATFPQATNDKIRGAMIRQSPCYDGHTIIIWRGEIEKKEYEGWSDTEKKCEYRW